MLDQLASRAPKPARLLQSARVYYADDHDAMPSRRSRGGTAIRSINDNQFVIAAYQASQIYGIGINAQNWSLTFGGNQCATSTTRVRRNLAVYASTTNPCRLQRGRDALSRACSPGHSRRRSNNRSGSAAAIGTLHASELNISSSLRQSCSLKLDALATKRTAASLRAHPELRSELNWHLAQVSTYLANADGLESGFRSLKRSFEQAL